MFAVIILQTLNSCCPLLCLVVALSFLEVQKWKLKQNEGLFKLVSHENLEIKKQTEARKNLLSYNYIDVDQQWNADKKKKISPC